MRSKLYNTDKKYVSAQMKIFFYNRFNFKINYLKHIKRCSICDNYFSIKNSCYCPICGSSDKFHVLRGENNNMIYESVEQDENKKAIQCPKCGNEQIVINGDFCKICGTYLLNECAITDRYDNGYGYVTPPCELGKKLDGNARYCPYCGNQTTYFQNGILKEYNAEGVGLIATDVPF